MVDHPHYVNNSDWREHFVMSDINDDTARLVIVTSDQVEILRRSIASAKKRGNWEASASGDGYITPDDDEWDTIEAIIDDLEYQLMSNLDPIEGDLIVGNAIPEWEKLAVTIPGADLINILAIAHTDTKPNYKTASSNPGAAVSVLASNAQGGLALAGHSAIGAQATIDPIYVLRLNELTSAVSGYFVGLASNIIAHPNGTSVAVVENIATSTFTEGTQNIGEVRALVNTVSHGTTGTLGTAYGLSNSITSTAGAGVLVLAYACWNRVSVGAGTTISAARAIQASVTNAGTLPSAFGLYVDALQAQTTNYGVYVAAQTAAATNYAIFTNAGKVRIGGEFGCNAATPQAKATVNAACTDLPTAIALINQLRAALVANGICV